MRYLTISFVFLLGLFIAACDSRPKVIESEPTVSDNSSVMDNAPAGQSTANMEEHKVVVKEALNTQRYSYLNVTEDGKDFWIAIPKKEVKIGGTYYYKGGLLKSNFQSQEFHRVFETVYLVSDVSDQPLGSGGTAVDQALSQSQTPPTVEAPTSVESAKGAIKISELVGHLNKYEGKLVKITGKCVKVNPMIMGRNWIHLQDGTANNYDLTVTTTDNIELGSVITLEGTIALKKDFGAGYKYDVIMEGAVVK